VQEVLRELLEFVVGLAPELVEVVLADEIHVPPAKTKEGVRPIGSSVWRVMP
jgi:hypothetical protein